MTTCRSAASARAAWASTTGSRASVFSATPRGIYIQGRWNSISMLQAPFGKRADRLLNFFLR
jgi:hypothetical protein